MTTLMRWHNKWNPFKEMEDLSNSLSALMSRNFGRPPVSAEGEENAIVQAEWAPLVDIAEDEKSYFIKAELPEVKKEDVKVNLESGVLTISGERRFEKEEKGKRYHRVERAYGTFSRSFTLPENADASKVNAEYKDGVLQVHVAKTEKAQPKAIDIKVA